MTNLQNNHFIGKQHGNSQDKFSMQDNDYKCSARKPSAQFEIAQQPHHFRAVDVTCQNT